MIQLLLNRGSILLLFLMLLSARVVTAQNLYDESHTLKFANYLSSSKQYGLAINEFERLLYFDSTNVAYQLGLIKGLRFNNQIELVGLRLNRFYPNGLCGISSSLAREYSIALLLDQGKSDQFVLCAANLSDLDKNNFMVAGALLSMDLASAKRMVSESNGINASLLQISQHDVKRLSPGLAAVFSTVVPGSGKIYAHKWKDGLFSLMIISGFAFQSIKAFNQKGINSPVGWVFGAFGAGYYVGNVYGSYQAARSFNEKQRETIREDVYKVLYSID